MLLRFLRIKAQLRAVFRRQRHQLAIRLHAVFLQKLLRARKLRVQLPVFSPQQKHPDQRPRRQRCQHKSENEPQRSSFDQEHRRLQGQRKRQQRKRGIAAAALSLTQALRLLRILLRSRDDLLLGKAAEGRRALRRYGRFLRFRRKPPRLRLQQRKLLFQLLKRFPRRQRRRRLLRLTARVLRFLERLFRRRLFFQRTIRLPRLERGDERLQLFLLGEIRLPPRRQLHVASVQSADLLERILRLLQFHECLRQKSRPVVAAAVAPVAQRFLCVGEADRFISRRHQRGEPLFQLRVRGQCHRALTDEGAALKDAPADAQQKLSAVFARHTRDRLTAGRLIGAEFAHRNAALCAALDRDTLSLPFQLHPSLHGRAAPWLELRLYREICLGRALAGIDAVEHRHQKRCPCRFSGFIRSRYDVQSLIQRQLRVLKAPEGGRKLQNSHSSGASLPSMAASPSRAASAMHCFSSGVSAAS